MSGKIIVVSEYLMSPWTSSPTKGWFHQAPWFVAAVRTTCSAWSALGQPSTCVYSSTPSEPPTSSIITHCATSFFEASGEDKTERACGWTYELAPPRRRVLGQHAAAAKPFRQVDRAAVAQHLEEGVLRDVEAVEPVDDVGLAGEDRDPVHRRVGDLYDELVRDVRRDRLRVVRRDHERQADVAAPDADL